MNRLIAKIILLMTLTFQLTGNAQEITAFQFSNVVARYGVAISNGPERLPYCKVNMIHSEATTATRELLQEQFG